MKTYVTDQRYGQPSGLPFPYLLLRSDNWNDFNLRTLYHLELHKSKKDSIDVGQVKIMRLGMGRTDSVALPEGALALDDNYCSLGQATSYYETLKAHLSPIELETFLRESKDVVSDPARYVRFADDYAFTTSLVREGGARRALTDGREILFDLSLDTHLPFSFATNVGGSQFVANFQFGDSGELPSRINAVIGYNGVGKTKLMANLSHVAWRDTKHRRTIAAQYGRMIPEDIPFGRVVAISYSAFDTFEVPPETEQYVYCGLRDFSASDIGSRLKSPTQIAAELEKALERMRTNDRWESLNAALAPMLREPSFQTSAALLDFRAGAKHWRPVFDTLSTGHKISLNIVVQLVAQLENKSLVLIDEPESHLHPPLLAALMKGISEALEETNSYAVIATHSPVVLQEVAARYVQVLRRYGDITIIETPTTETFGENVGILTRTVFNLDNTESDYQGVLRSLAATYGADGLDEIFPMGLSSQALAIVMEAEVLHDDDEVGH